MSNSNERTTLLRHIEALRNRPSRAKPNPTWKDILDVAPHLEKVEADELITEAKEVGRCYFLGPPTLIRGAYHAYNLCMEAGELILYWAYVYRTKESYDHRLAGTPDRHGNFEQEWDYIHRAQIYAEVTWGTQLMWDKSQATLLCHVMDPDRMATDSGVPLVAKRALLMLSQWLTEGGRQPWLPVSMFIDRNTIMSTADTVMIEEVIADVNPACSFHCLHCGGGLLLEECSYCRREVKVGKFDFRPNLSPFTIPTKAVMMLGPGVFKLDPLHALKAETRVWAYDDSPQPTRAKQKRQRSVVLHEET